MAIASLETGLENYQDEYSSLRPINLNSLNPEQLELLQRLSSFEAPYLEEKLLRDRKFSSREEYQEAFTEWKKYAALTQFTGKRIGMTSQPVDDVWHQFILFTPQYHQFCNDFLGKYLHHVPETSFTPRDKSGRINFVKSYQALFGELHPLWNSETDCNSGDGCHDQCGTCNICGS